MSATRVSFLFFILFAGVEFCRANHDALATLRKFEVEEKRVGKNDLHFLIPMNRTSSLESDVEVRALCTDSKMRVLLGTPTEHFELLTEYFSDGQVRQFVVKLYGRELGLIKVERPALRAEKEYTQARFEITDPSDRIMGEVANAENSGSEFIVRDGTRQIIAKGYLSKQKWEVDSNQLHPLLTAVLLCAAEAERNPCDPKTSVMDTLHRVGFAMAIGLTVGLVGFAWFAHPNGNLNRQR